MFINAKSGREIFSSKLFNKLEKKGFVIVKRKIGRNSLFSTLQFNRTLVRFEALFKKANGILAEYTTAEGNLITVSTLTPENLIHEKIDAYLTRFKIRDLYDIFFLLRDVKDKTPVRSKINSFLKNFKAPVDEKELKVLILEGLVPDTRKMIDYIRQWERKNI